MTARLCVATIDKGMAIACEPRLDPNHHWGSECRLIRVRVSMYSKQYIRPAAGVAAISRAVAEPAFSVPADRSVLPVVTGLFPRLVV